MMFLMPWILSHVPISKHDMFCDICDRDRQANALRIGVDDTYHVHK